MTEPAWTPDEAAIRHANVTATAARLGLSSFREFHQWSIENRSSFWADVIDQLGINFERPPDEILPGTPLDPEWLSGARFNIAASCLDGDPDRPAIVHRRNGADLTVARGELRDLCFRFAAGFASAGFRPGDGVAIAMIMNLESIVAYLGTVLAGGVVVSIADSFSPAEIETRLRVTEPVAVVTQDRIVRLGKELPMFDKVVAAGAERCIVVDTGGDVVLRREDIAWDDFMGDDGVGAVPREASAPTNILFSSGTTGDPKAIPWSQITPLKAAMDGRYHQDIHADDVVAWPTNLGWMMGPWLIYAALLNGAAFALYDDAPTDRGFTSFVADAGVTVLGLVPSLAAAWRAGGALDDVDWSRVRVLSSTGEASNPVDYRWLMGRVGAPVIEYVGGTEIGGAYLAGTVVEPAFPSQFTTPTLGLDVRILDDEGRPTNNGELFIVPPSIGLSTELLNQDHEAVYTAGVPDADVPLRRHGDHMERLDSGNFRALGRIDDTMNLGGIKVSSADLERVITSVPGVAEAAAVAVPPPGGGPGRLVVFAVIASDSEWDAPGLQDPMQAAIRRDLNPLFRIHEVVILDALPRTASQKVMRRSLRSSYDG